MSPPVYPLGDPSMDNTSVLQHIADSVDYVRGRVDALGDKLETLTVQFERRVTRLEVRTGLIALAISAAVSVAAALVSRP